MSYPVAAKKLVGLFGQGDVAVLGSFTAMDMDHHALAVNVRNLEGESLRDPQAAGMREVE